MPPTPQQIIACQIILGRSAEYVWEEGDIEGTMTLTLPQDDVGAQVKDMLADMIVQAVPAAQQGPSSKPSKADVMRMIEEARNFRDEDSSAGAAASSRARFSCKGEVVPGHWLITVDEHVLACARQVLNGREMG